MGAVTFVAQVVNVTSASCTSKRSGLLFRVMAHERGGYGGTAVPPYFAPAGAKRPRQGARHPQGCISALYLRTQIWRTNGAIIDEVTNVYAMGATAFCLFASSNRSPEAWPLSPELYAVASRATSDERDERQQSIRQLIEEWRAAQ
jgi:hypothetical protein